MHFIHFLAIQEMERRQDDVLMILRVSTGLETLDAYPSGAIRGSFETHPDDWTFSNTIIVFDFAPVVPVHSSEPSGIRLSINHPETFPDWLTKDPFYSDFDAENFQEIVRTRKSRGPFIAIISGGTLLDFTNMDCMVNRVYSF